MYLDKEDETKIKEYMIQNRNHLNNLESIIALKERRKQLEEKFDRSFYEEIETEFLKVCKLPMAEDISRNTGLAADGILYVMDCMGLDNFKIYMGEEDDGKTQTN